MRLHHAAARLKRILHRTPSLMDEHFFRRLCEHAGIATIALDSQLQIVFWNKAAGQLFGRSPDQMVGRSLLSLVPESRRSLAERLLRRTLREGTIGEFDVQHEDAAGRRIDLAVTLSPIPGAQGVPVGVAVHLRDITRRTKAERALAEARKMSALGAMAGAVAHHFNNLLGGLMTTLDFARQNRDPAAVRRALNGMMEPLSRAVTITHALLAFAEGDRTDDEIGDVNTVVERFVTELRPALMEENIILETTLQAVEAALPTRKLKTILESLTANAREAMPAGGCLRIALERTEHSNEFVLQLSDTGCGINDSVLEHVFEPFFTTHPADPRTGRCHLGLGLAVVHGVVKELGGTVTLCSSPESGTICSVRLPRSVPRPA